MRILGIGEYGDLGDMYFRLAEAGHEVKVFIEDPDFDDVFGGMLRRTADWQLELGWLREAGEQGIALFESAQKGQLQDELRHDGFQVIGGSAYGDRLEAEREYGQAALRDFGLCTAASHRFRDFAEAAAFIERNPARYVFKGNGADSPRTRNYIGQLASGKDMLSLLSLYQMQWQQPDAPDFVLMDYIDGVEVGVGAYFNGEEFLDAVCLDWEHKRFFDGELGELTGEMGTIVTYRGAGRIFEATLARMAPALREGGYCGYINLNLMANENGLWPLEFTSRFGYPGFAICEALHDEPWDKIFCRMLRHQSRQMRTRSGFAAGVVLTVPPFPYREGYARLSKGFPICLDEMNTKDYAALHFAEVARQGSQIVTSGVMGYVGVATGTGPTVADAAREAYALARKVILPNVRYRTDIGARVMRHDLQRLKDLHLID
ncbi:MAG: phosphoribosylglycinamide synthetase C domain-containing protein [Pseudomonadota bacterium]